MNAGQHFGIAGTLCAVFLIVLAVFVVVIIFLRLGIAAVYRATPPKSKSPA